MAPGFFCPKCAKEHAEGKEGHADVDEIVGNG